jgi:hypothetical protein
MTMRKILIAVGVLVIALAFGTAYAAEKNMDGGLYNGVTAFVANPAPTMVETPEVALENGITVFTPEIKSAKAEEYGSSGSAAGGMATEERDKVLYNGITDFNH